ncbi:hypothetical protein [Pseudobacteriovorax antillogorgiicola]|nr:hypothetical protein [Pseudobacteriovorax antillogorgiicola]
MTSCGDKCGRNPYETMIGKSCPKKDVGNKPQSCISLNQNNCHESLDKDVVWYSETNPSVQSFFKFTPDGSYQQYVFLKLNGFVFHELRVGKFFLSQESQLLSFSISSSSCQSDDYSLFYPYDQSNFELALLRQDVNPVAMFRFLPELIIQYSGQGKNLFDKMLHFIVDIIFSGIMTGIKEVFTHEFWTTFYTGQVRSSDEGAALLEGLLHQSNQTCFSTETFPNDLTGTVINTYRP